MNDDAGGSETITAGIRVRVRSRYLPEEAPERSQERLFGYHIVIQNETEQPVQLLRRHWLIIDAAGVPDEVDGDGVVGEQPLIPAGGRHAYGSFCPLMSDWGTMEGSFTMADHEGRLFSVAVKRFHLFMPRDQRALVAT